MRKLSNYAMAISIALGGILEIAIGLCELRLLIGTLSVAWFIGRVAIGGFLVVVGCWYFVWSVRILKMLWQGYDL